MTTSDNSLGGRLGLLRPNTLTAEQRTLYDQLQAKTVPWADKSGFRATTDAGELIGPFNPMLRSPLIAKTLLNVESTESARTPP